MMERMGLGWGQEFEDEYLFLEEEEEEEEELEEEESSEEIELFEEDSE